MSFFRFKYVRFRPETPLLAWNRYVWSDKKVSEGNHLILIWALAQLMLRERAKIPYLSGSVTVRIVPELNYLSRKLSIQRLLKNKETEVPIGFFHFFQGETSVIKIIFSWSGSSGTQAFAGLKFLFISLCYLITKVKSKSITLPLLITCLESTFRILKDLKKNERDNYLIELTSILLNSVPKLLDAKKMTTLDEFGDTLTCKAMFV